MAFLYSHRLAIVCLCAGFFLPILSFAQGSCGNIVEIIGGQRFEDPIEDCDNPFGIPHLNPDLEVLFGDTVLEEGSEYPFLNEVAIFSLQNVNPDADFVSAALYLHEGEDYLLKRQLDDGDPLSFTATGTYTLVVEEGEDPVVSKRSDLIKKIRDLLLPVAHAFHGPSLVLMFSIVEPNPEPEIDPLILQYEPILRFHPDENFLPMNVEPFIEASALWDDRDALPDELLKAESEIDPVTIDDISILGSEDWYLAFSDGSEPKSFDPDVARAKYEDLITEGKAQTTYYAYKMEDSFIDDEGEEHEFIVLQYWHFYAFNDWAVHGGFNNHEGDWESVMVFLDKDTEEPKYIAYSAHHNDGEADFFQGKYDSVRRSWDSNEVVRDGDNANSFIALGSHANYPNNDEGGIHKTSTNDDLTSLIGDSINDSWEERVTIMDEDDPIWMAYEGKWGADSLSLGEDGPQGPNFIDVGGNVRFHEPIVWAGIDKIAEKVINEPTDILLFGSQSILMTFSELLETGESFLADLHEEVISFGGNIQFLNLLPQFWDIESSLENDTFEATVSFNYNEAQLEDFTIAEENLAAFFFNEETGEWEELPSIVDLENNVVSFVATHLSRYAIGESTEETTEEIYERLHELVDETELNNRQKRGLHGLLRLSEFLAGRDKPILNRAALVTLRLFEQRVQRFEKRGKISTELSSEIYAEVEKLI